MNKPLTAADAIRLTMDHFYSDPRSVVSALMAVEDDDETVNSILQEAKRRGLDLRPALIRTFPLDSSMVYCRL